MSQASRNKPATCSRCGETWPRDPALEVPCPSCHAGVGSPCKRPSEHKAWTLHAARDRAAMKAGKLKKCQGSRTKSTMLDIASLPPMSEESLAGMLNQPHPLLQLIKETK